MAGEPSVVDFSDPRRQHAAGQNQFEAVNHNTRPRASSIVREDGYRPEHTRSGHAQPAGGGEANAPAVPQSDLHAQVPPELIAQITATVINQLKTTRIDSVSPGAAANARHPPQQQPPPQWAASAASASPSTDPATSPPPYARKGQTPPSPHAPAEIPRGASPRSQIPILQPDPMHPHGPLSAAFHDTGASPPLSEPSEAGYTRPKGPSRLSTGKEETTLEKIWGQLFDEECNPTIRLGQLLRGLAIHIVSGPRMRTMETR